MICWHGADCSQGLLDSCVAMIPNTRVESTPLGQRHWELAMVDLIRHVALDMLCQEVYEAWLLGCRCQKRALCHSKETKEKGCGERHRCDKLKL